MNRWHAWIAVLLAILAIVSWLPLWFQRGFDWAWMVVPDAQIPFAVTLSAAACCGWLVSALAVRDGAGDGETRCRRCRHILRGISEPRCPECGERI